MDIETILDLATSIVFRHASQIHRAADNPQELFAAAGRVPLDYMNDGYEGQDRRPGKLSNHTCLYERCNPSLLAPYMQPR